MMNTFLLHAISVFCVFLMVLANVEFTNVKCVELEKSIINFYDCRIVAVNRSYKYLTVKLHVREPIIAAKANFAVMKRLNGFKPFLYNFTYDACAYHLIRKKNPMVKFFHDFFAEYVNFDHPCPYDHDIIFDKLSNQHVNNKTTFELPVPRGEYALYTIWIINGKKDADVRVYIKLT